MAIRDFDAFEEGLNLSDEELRAKIYGTPYTSPRLRDIALSEGDEGSFGPRPEIGPTPFDPLSFFPDEISIPFKKKPIGLGPIGHLPDPAQLRTDAAQLIEAESARIGDADLTRLSLSDSIGESVYRGDTFSDINRNIYKATMEGDVEGARELTELKEKYVELWHEDEKNRLSGKNTRFLPDFVADWAITAGASLPGMSRGATAIIGQEAVAWGAVALTALAITAVAGTSPVWGTIAGLTGTAAVGFAGLRKMHQAIRFRRKAGTFLDDKVRKSVGKVTGGRFAGRKDFATMAKEVGLDTVIDLSPKALRRARMQNTAFGAMRTLTMASQFQQEGGAEMIAQLEKHGIDPQEWKGLIAFGGWMYGAVEGMATMVPLASGTQAVIGRAIKAKMMGKVNSTVMASLTSSISKWGMNSVLEAFEEWGQDFTVGGLSEVAVRSEIRERNKILDEFESSLQTDLINSLKDDPELAATPIGTIFIEGFKSFKDALGPSIILAGTGGTIALPGELMETGALKREALIAKEVAGKTAARKAERDNAKTDLEKTRLSLKNAKEDGDFDEWKTLEEKVKVLELEKEKVENEKLTNFFSTNEKVGNIRFHKSDSKNVQKQKFKEIQDALEEDGLEFRFDDPAHLYGYMGNPLDTEQAEAVSPVSFHDEYTKIKTHGGRALFLASRLDVINADIDSSDFKYELAAAVEMSPEATTDEMLREVGEDRVARAIDKVQRLENTRIAKERLPIRYTPEELKKSREIEKKIDYVSGEMSSLTEKRERGDALTPEEEENLNAMQNVLTNLQDFKTNIENQILERYQTSRRAVEAGEQEQLIEPPSPEELDSVKATLAAKATAEALPKDNNFVQSINSKTVEFLSYVLNNIRSGPQRQGLNFISNILSFSKPPDGSSRIRALDRDFGTIGEGPIIRLNKKLEELKRYISSSDYRNELQRDGGVRVLTRDEKNPLGVSMDLERDDTSITPQDIRVEGVKEVFVPISEIYSAIDMVTQQRDTRISKWDKKGGITGLLGSIDLIDDKGTPIGEHGYSIIIETILSAAIVEKTRGVGVEGQTYSLKEIPWATVNEALRDAGIKYRFVINAPKSSGRVRKISKELKSTWEEVGAERGGAFADHWSHMRHLLYEQGIDALPAKGEADVGLTISAEGLEKNYREAILDLRKNNARFFNKPYEFQVSFLLERVRSSFEDATRASEGLIDNDNEVSDLYGRWAAYRSILASVKSENLSNRVLRGVEVILMMASIEPESPMSSVDRAESVVVGAEATDSLGAASGKVSYPEMEETAAKASKAQRAKDSKQKEADHIELSVNEVHDIAGDAGVSSLRVELSEAIVDLGIKLDAARGALEDESGVTDKRATNLPAAIEAKIEEGKEILDIPDEAKFGKKFIEARYIIAYAEALRSGELEPKNEKEANVKIDMDEAAEAEIAPPQTLAQLKKQIREASPGKYPPGKIGRARADALGALVRGVAAYRGIPTDEYVRLRFRGVVSGLGPHGKKRTKALVEIDSDGRALIRALDKTNVADMAHELAHVFRKDLNPSDLAAAAKWAGVRNKRGIWSEEAEENFAEGFEKYLMEGKAPTEQLRSIFEQFKRWLSVVYNRVAASSRFSQLKISPDIREVFDNLVKGGEVFHKTEELSALDEEYMAEIEKLSISNEKSRRRYKEIRPSEVYRPDPDNLRIRRLVFRAAKDAGYKLGAVHGTPDGGFTVFDTKGERIGLDKWDELVTNVSGADPTSFIGTHFAVGEGSALVAKQFMMGLYQARPMAGATEQPQDLREAYGRAGTEKGPQIYKVFLKIQNPKKFTAEEFENEVLIHLVISNRDFSERWFKENAEAYGESSKATGDDLLSTEAGMDTLADMYKSYSAEIGSGEEGLSIAKRAGREFREYLVHSGHDGVIYENAQEGGTSAIVFEPNQIKSAGVTRDEEGNVIPLSQRFDPTEASILYKTEELSGTVTESLAKKILGVDDLGNPSKESEGFISLTSTRKRKTGKDPIGLESDQTGLEGIRAETLYEVRSLARKHKVKLVVTGGTERGVHVPGDFSHEEGYKIDLRYREKSKLSSLIKGWKMVERTREVKIPDESFPGGFKLDQDGNPVTKEIKEDGYINPDTGAIYWLEGNHWDIEVDTDLTREHTPPVEVSTPVAEDAGSNIDRLKDEIPDSPISSFNDISDSLKKDFPLLEMYVEEGKFFVKARDEVVEIQISPHELTMEDAEVVSQSIIPAGQKIVEEDGTVPIREEDLIRLSKASKESEVRHSVLEWIMNNVLEQEDRETIIGMFPPDPGNVNEPYHNIASMLEQWTLGSPKTIHGIIFSKIVNLARSILSLPLTDQAKIDAIRDRIFVGTMQTSSLLGDSWMWMMQGGDETMGGAFPRGQDAWKNFSLMDLRKLSRDNGVDEEKIKSEFVSKEKAMEFLYGDTREAGWIKTNPSVTFINNRRTSGFHSPEEKGSPTQMLKDGQGLFITNLRTKMEMTGMSRVFATITRGQDKSLEANVALRDFLSEKTKDVNVNRIFRKTNAGRMTATLGGRTRKWQIDVLLEIARASQSEYNRKVIAAADRNTIAEPASWKLKGLIEIPLGKITEEEQLAVKQLIEQDADLRMLMEVDVELKKKEMELLQEVVDEFIDRLVSLGAKVRTEKGNIRIAEISEELREELDLDVELKEISSFVPVENYYPLKIVVEKKLHPMLQGKAYDLAKAGVLQRRQPSPPIKQHVYHGSFTQNMVSRIDHVSKIYGMMIPIWEANRHVNSSAVKDAIVSKMGIQTHQGLKNGLDSLNGRSYEKGFVDRVADALIHRTTVQGLVGIWTMLKMFLSFPLLANLLRNRLNLILAASSRISVESEEQFQLDGLTRNRYRHGFRSDPNIFESFQGGMAKAILTTRPRGEGGIRESIKRNFKSSGLELLKIPDQGALRIAWKAAEREVRQFRPELRGKDLWSEVSRLYRHLVRTTQPISEKSEQAQIIADRRGLTRGLLFYGQRLSMVNQLYRDWDAFMNAENVEQQIAATRQVRFSMVNILVMNSSIMTLIGMQRRKLYELASELWGDKDEEIPEEKSFMSWILKGLIPGIATQNVQLFPFLAELSELVTATWRASRGEIAGDVMESMAKMIGNVKSIANSFEDLEKTRPYTKQRARVEDRIEKSIKSLGRNTAYLNAYLLKVPLRGIEGVVDSVAGATKGFLDFIEDLPEEELRELDKDRSEDN